jgi:hypothetical protein
MFDFSKLSSIYIKKNNPREFVVPISPLLAAIAILEVQKSTGRFTLEFKYDGGEIISARLLPVLNQ